MNVEAEEALAQRILVPILVPPLRVLCHVKCCFGSNAGQGQKTSSSHLPCLATIVFGTHLVYLLHVCSVETLFRGIQCLPLHSKV